MSNLIFLAGPISQGKDYVPGSFSPNAYESFQRVIKENPEPGLYGLWLNENFHDTYRRLALRALLRASYDGHGEHPGIPDLSLNEYDENAEIWYTRTHILHRVAPEIPDENTAPELYRELKNRPKLCKEVIAEFLHNLRENYVAKTSWRDIELLELLLSVANGNDAWKLWQFHPLKTGKIPGALAPGQLDRDPAVELDLNATEKVSLARRLTHRRAKLPKFLRDEIRENFLVAKK